MQGIAAAASLDFAIVKQHASQQRMIAGRNPRSKGRLKTGHAAPVLLKY